MMRLIQFAFASLVILVASSDKAQAEFITNINANAATSALFIGSSSTGDGGFEDGVLRVLYNGNRIDTFMRFNLGSIPNAESINSLKLTLFSSTLSGTPGGDPALEVYLSNVDVWVDDSTFSDNYLVNPLMTTAATGPFPTSALSGPFVFTLDATKVDWSNQLLDVDDQLTLVLRTVNNTTDNLTYWQGTGGSSIAPFITVSYGDVAAVPEPSSLALFGISSLVARCVFVRRRRIQKAQAEPV